MAPDECVETDSMSEHNGQRKSVQTLPRLGYYLVTLQAGISTRRNKVAWKPVHAAHYNTARSFALGHRRSHRGELETGMA
jgi:hypothetical protein